MARVARNSLMHKVCVHARHNGQGSHITHVVYVPWATDRDPNAARTTAPRSARPPCHRIRSCPPFPPPFGEAVSVPVLSRACSQELARPASIALVVSLSPAAAAIASAERPSVVSSREHHRIVSHARGSTEEYSPANRAHSSLRLTHSHSHPSQPNFLTSIASPAINS